MFGGLHGLRHVEGIQRGLGLNMSSEDYLKNGRKLREDGYICTMDGMSKKELIEEILGTHSHDYLVEMGFIKKLETTQNDD